MIIETRALSKKFGTMFALQDVNFSVKKGEIHGLVGENGAGKSTLIKILTGVYHLTGGEVLVDGNPVTITDPTMSRNLGINVIHQDRNLVPSFNGVENIYLGLPSIKKHLVTVDFKKMKARVEKVMEEYGIEVPLEALAQELSPPQKTLLEIVRAMMTQCKLLILDEPTASLTDKETAILFNIIRKLNEKGTTILYITHRMEEIFQLTDRITVFKNGNLIQTVQTKETSKDQLIALMTDNWKSSKKELSEKRFHRVLFSASHIATTNNVVLDASLEVHAGEILGIFGLAGSGRTELLEALYGYKGIQDGQVNFKGEQITSFSPSRSIQRGIVLIHEDRRGHSLILSRSIKNNIVLPIIDTYVSKGFYQSKKERADTQKKVDEMNIVCQGIDQPVYELSGGNQQKVVFAKSLMSGPDLFLCDEPTQAVDVKTREEIHTLLRSCADTGKAIVFVTSDLQEMLEIADNILIMANGKTWELLPNTNLTSEQILHLCYEKR
ncbi:MAG: sugar ABC transporter ATP-binding protein [Sphaerochaeta sp.]|nr:sugar ABC transporter ATP-binding protein [Sphaerochaeta sp.]